MLQQLIAREIESKPGGRRADEAGDHPRLQRAGAAGQAGRRHLQEDAAVQPRRARPAASSAGSASARRTCRPPGAMFGYRRQARHDRRLRQSGAARLDATGCRSTAIGTRARACRCRAARSLVDAKGRRRRPTSAPKGLVSAKCVNDGPRGYLSIRTNADPKRQAHRPHRRRGRRARHVPARLGHAPCRHARTRRATSSARSARSALDPEQLLDAELERLRRA